MARTYTHKKARLLLSRREAMLTAAMGAMTVALGGCANGNAAGSARGSSKSAKAAADKIVEAVDRDWAYDFIKELSLIGNDGCELGFRNAGSTGEQKCRERIVKEMKELGLEVTVDSFPVHAWEFKSAELVVGDATYELSSFAGAPGTDGPLTAQIVDLGDGTAANYEGKDVAGKIVLTHFDNYNYWFMAPAYQAELAGAKAIIVETIGENYNVGKDTLYCFDVASRDTIPVLCISKDDAPALGKQLEEGETAATLTVDATIDYEGTSANVLGMIPGRDGTDQNITLGAHYDGYFHAFMDDVFGVGTLLSIAKAIKETGYEPEHNLIFIAFGSEEYGTTSNHYDWCTGVWNQINVCRPEWVGKTICHLEMDSVRPDADTWIVNATPELHSFFKDKLAALEPPAKQYTEGAKLAAQNGPWGQDYDMEIAGVPGLCAGKTGNSVWKTLNYHTNGSSPENDWNEIVFNWVVDQYTRMLLDFDACAIAPLDFSTNASQVLESFDKSLVDDADSAAGYLDAVEHLKEVSSKHYELVARANELVAKARKSDVDISSVWADLMSENSDLLAAFKILQADHLKLDIWDVVAYKHDVMQLNISSLNDAISALKKANGQDALDSLFNVDTTYLASCFSKEVYEYTGIAALDPERDDLFWGTGKVMKQVNTYDVYHAIADKVEAKANDYADEIAMLEDLLSEEKVMFDEAVAQDTGYIEQVSKMIEASELSDCVERLEGLVA